MYINSNNIKVYPTASRDATIDYGANMNLEQNIISMSNNITDYHSYIVSGLSVTFNNSVITVAAGDCVINGYNIKLIGNPPITMTNITADPSKVLYIKLNHISLGEITRVNGIDSSNEYTGLELLYDKDYDASDVWQLKLAIIDSDVIPEPKAVKFKGDNIQINLDRNLGLTENIYSGSLINWLENTLVIDDGEI